MPTNGRIEVFRCGFIKFAGRVHEALESTSIDSSPEAARLSVDCRHLVVALSIGRPEDCCLLGSARCARYILRYSII